VWGKWAYPASDPSQVNLAVQWSYSGPPVTLDQIVSGDVADFLNPANYSISEESRVYAGFLNGPGGFLVNWLPVRPASQAMQRTRDKIGRCSSRLIASR
jgi:hypothetical protein